MKRIVYLSAIVFCLATSVAGCAGVSGGGAKDGSSDSDDPVTALKAIGEGIQKDIDGLMQPFKDADGIIDEVAKLPAELKASVGAKVDTKKLMAAANKIVAGEDPNIDGLGLTAEAKAKVTARFDKLKALVTSIKTLDDKVKSLGGKIKDAVVQIPALGAKATAKIQLTLSNPLAGADSKKTAEQDKKTIDEIIKGFTDKAAEWQKALTEIPPKAKDLPGKMTKAFK